jgi:hypothetical protein
MATREEIEAAVAVIERWHGIVDVEFLARQTLEAAEQVRNRPVRVEATNSYWTHPLIREDRPE